MFLILFISLLIALVVEELKYHFTNAGSYLVQQSIFRLIEIILTSAFLFIFRNSPTSIKNIYQKTSQNSSNNISINKNSSLK